METDYQRIEKAIHFIRENFREQPDLREIARQVHVSPFHFQRMFTEWAGISPKKFLQYTSVEYAKKMLQEQKTLSEVSFEAGFSGTSRLHDLFIAVEAMTPGDFKKGGEGLRISYQFKESPFGEVIIASTETGICHLAFITNKTDAIRHLKERFPNATFAQQDNLMHEKAMAFFRPGKGNLTHLKLHLKGTPFQLKVWDALIRIPFGRLKSYAEVARSTGHANASRAV